MTIDGTDMVTVLRDPIGKANMSGDLTRGVPVLDHILEERLSITHRRCSEMVAVPCMMLSA